MYLSHFGLNEPPFRITPHTDFFFEGANRGATLGALLYAISHEEGIIKITGEVGSGKTAVAFAAMLAVVAAGGQAALLAPTEILAEQHYVTLSEFLRSAQVRIGLFTGSATAKERRDNLEALAAGEIHLAIGTHALIQKDVEFDKLGQSMGAHGERVSDPKELKPALQRALATGGCAVIHVDVDPVKHMWAPGLIHFKKMHEEPKA